MEKEKLTIREILFTVYIFSVIYILPIYVWYILLKDKITFVHATGILLYGIPSRIHAGAFGSKLKGIVDSIIRYKS